MSRREYTPAKPREHVCPICGQKFLGHGSKIYCSDECKDEAYRLQRRAARAANPEKAKADSRRWYEAPKQKKAEEAKNKVTLEDKLKDLKASGKTYAEAQRAETIERWARVEIPAGMEASSPFEESAKPAEDRPATEPERRRNMSKHIMSSSVREFLAELKGALTVIASNDDVFGQTIAAYAERVEEILKEEAGE